MDNIIPDEFRLDPVHLRPPKLRDGTFRPISPYEHLVNHELLLVLNGKPVGYTLDFSIESNRNLDTFEFDNRTLEYSEADRENISDIFSLATLNNIKFVSAGNPSWGVYFQEENINKALLLDFYLRRFNQRTVVSSYIISRLQGHDPLDIEANIFCYRNGENIVQRRQENANNYNYIMNIGNQRIREIQESTGFQEYLKKVTIKNL